LIAPAAAIVTMIASAADEHRDRVLEGGSFRRTMV
jgi:hypothetical protein